MCLEIIFGEAALEGSDVLNGHAGTGALGAGSNASWCGFGVSRAECAFGPPVSDEDSPACDGMAAAIVSRLFVPSIALYAGSLSKEIDAAGTCRVVYVVYAVSKTMPRNTKR